MSEMKKENADIRAEFDHILIVKNTKFSQWGLGVRDFDGRIFGFEITADMAQTFLNLQEEIKNRKS